MPRNNEFKFADCFDLPNPGLRSYFDIVERGQPDEYRTTFAKGSSVQKVLSDWKPTIDTLVDKWPSLVEFENDLARKVGPMSIMKPLKDRMKDIDSYYEGILLPQEPLSLRSLKAVIAEFRSGRGLKLRSQESTVDLMKKSTNSGSPYFTKRTTALKWMNLPIQIYHNGHLQYLNRYDVTDWPINYCAILGWRGQEGGPSVDDVKQRVVWMFPFAVNIEELTGYQPIVESAQRLNVVPAWVGMEQVDQRVTRMFDTKGGNDYVVCTDFSKFDQHFNPVCQEAARSIIAACFEPTRAAIRWLEEIFPIKYDIPLAYSYGHLRFGKHGMGSGSGGTNADETLVHRALQYECAQELGKRLNPNSQCLGDDGVLTYPGIKVEDVVRSYTRHGLEMNPDKQYVSKHDCIYLRRWHHQNYRVDGVCVGVYSTYRALGRLCEQERFYDSEVWSKEMTALRQLSIIENVKYHPLGAEFVEFCMKRDKFRLGIDIPGFLDNIDGIAEKAIDLMPDFLGYTKSLGNNQTGLSQWWVVKYLKSK